MKLTTTITSIAVHPEGENPVFGERTISIRLDDEGGGAFFVVSQDSKEIRLDPGELELLLAAGKKLFDQKGIE